jgi:hypothetical protein
VRRHQPRDNGPKICRLDFTAFGEIIRTMLDQDNPTKGRSQKYDEPSQEPKDGLHHGGEVFLV